MRNTGKVSEETNRLDQLFGIAGGMAWHEVEDRKRTPPEDGWDLVAAENGMTVQDYFTVMSWEIHDRFNDKIRYMTQEEQEFMLAIDDPESWHARYLKVQKWQAKPFRIHYPVYQEDTDILF